jgi:hypothetical protein
MANGNVTITNGKGATKFIGAEAFRLISKGTGVAKIRNEDWWLDGTEKPEIVLKPKPGQKTPEKKQPASKPANNFVPQELLSMKEVRELREKVKDLEDEMQSLSAENMQLKIRLEQAEKPAAVVGEGGSGGATTQKEGAKTDPAAKAEKLGPDGKPENKKP